MKLLTHALLGNDQSPNHVRNSLAMSHEFFQEEIKQSSGTGNTPRFATDEEIENEEKKLLLSFAFKDNDEIEKFRKEMTFIINQEPIIERPPDSYFKSLKTEIRRKLRSS